jgi:hypothetical protein
MSRFPVNDHASSASRRTGMRRNAHDRFGHLSRIPCDGGNSPTTGRERCSITTEHPVSPPRCALGEVHDKIRGYLLISKIAIPYHLLWKHRRIDSIQCDADHRTLHRNPPSLFCERIIAGGDLGADFGNNRSRVSCCDQKGFSRKYGLVCVRYTVLWDFSFIRRWRPAQR